MSTPRKGTLTRLQDATIQFNRGLRNFVYPELGPAFAEIERGDDLAAALVTHRATAKYEVPNSQSSKQRRDASIRDTLAYDADGLTHFDWRALTLEKRRAWLNAREWLSKTFKDFRPSYRFVPPSGESSFPGMGRVDIMYKLSDISFWEVSSSALPTVTAIIYNSQALKSVVRRHFKAHCVDRTGQPADLRKRLWSQEWSSDSGVSRGYYVFSRMVMCLMTLCDISRMSTVPKNNAKDRVISMEPFWNMVAQLSFMSDMRAHVQMTRGIYVQNLADLHKTLIRHRTKATIDLRNASNSVWRCVVDALWPSRVLRGLNGLRTSTTMAEFSDGEEQYHHWNMFGPMGCGLTFDVMTFTLWAIGQHFGSVSVFGDDIIIDGVGAEPLIDMLGSLGIQINQNKTFITGPFRESCGGFHDLERGVDLVSFDLHYPTNLVEGFAFINKLRRIVDARQVTTSLLQYLDEWWQKLSDLVPLCFSVREGDLGCGAIVREAPPGKVDEILSQMWQRPVFQGRICSLETSPEKGEFVAAEAAYRYRRREYLPAPRRSEPRMHTCDQMSGTRTSNVPRLSFIV